MANHSTITPTRKLNRYDNKSISRKLVLRNEAAMRAIPESHLICTSTIPGRDLELLRSRSQGRVWDIDTGHDLMLTEPEWVAEKLVQGALIGHIP
jgi:hypothetical protein